MKTVKNRSLFSLTETVLNCFSFIQHECDELRCYWTVKNHNASNNMPVLFQNFYDIINLCYNTIE